MINHVLQALNCNESVNMENTFEKHCKSICQLQGHVSALLMQHNVGFYTPGHIMISRLSAQ